MPTQKRTQNATHHPPTPHKTSQPKRLQPTQQHTNIPTPTHTPIFQRLCHTEPSPTQHAVYALTQQPTPRPPQHIPKTPTHTRTTPPTHTTCPPPRPIPTPHQHPIQPRAPRHAPLPTIQPPTRLLTQPKPTLHPPKPHLQLPPLPQLQQQLLQRHRQPPSALVITNRVYPKRHRLARLALLRALVMPPHHKHKKHSLAPPQPTTRTQHLHRQAHRTPPHRHRHLLPARALAPFLLRCPHLVAVDPPTPPTRSGLSGQLAPARVFARAHTTNRTCGKSNCPNALVSPRPSPTHSSSCSGRPAALSHPRTRCRLTRSSPLSRSVARWGWRSVPLGRRSGANRWAHSGRRGRHQASPPSRSVVPCAVRAQRERFGD
jgi:hypothetical protein